MTTTTLTPEAILTSLTRVVLTGYALAITAMVCAQPRRDVVAFHLLATSWLAVIGFVLGWLLALTNVNGVLGGQLLPSMAAHIICMVAGWVGLTLLGVGYKLIGLFTLAERAMDQLSGKISTFLIWLHTYAPLAGKVAVPQLDAMYDRRLAFVGLEAWMAGAIAIAMMLLGWLPVWRGWSIGLLAGGAIVAVNVGRIARHWRGPVATPVRHR